MTRAQERLLSPDACPRRGRPPRLSSSAATASIELYDPGLGSFSTIGNLALSRRDHAASLLPDNNALVIGGLYDCCNTSSNDLRRFSGELFNLTNNTSTLLASHLNIPRARIPE